MDLLDDDQLERSAVVANCRMNRERGLLGSNGYGRELGFDPPDELAKRRDENRRPAWLDLCCGSGKALIEAAQIARDRGFDVEIVGVDLVGLFRPIDPDPRPPRLIEVSWRRLRPDRRFDLITCVHGLHYVGDKLGLIAQAVSWLTEGGLFAANLDPRNLKRANGEPAGRTILADLRRSGLEYDRKRRLVVGRGGRTIAIPHQYLGANDQAGPNRAGQPAVDSYYAMVDASANLKP